MKQKKLAKVWESARQGKKVRLPTLGTVLMIENYLEEHKEEPIKISELRGQLPKQVMYQTLKITLAYLWESGKIMYGPKGIQWIYARPKHLKKMLEDALEV